MNGPFHRRLSPWPIIGAGAACALLVACTSGRSAHSHDAEEANSPQAAGPSAAAAHMDSYYLSTCALCGGLLGAKGESPEVIREGRRLRLCSSACVDAYDRDPAEGRQRVDSVMVADQRPFYPLTTSLVTGRPLGPHAVDFIWGNRLFRAADGAERDLILADPVRYMRALDEAVIAAQSPTYGMPDKCPVQGDILQNDVPIDMVVANRMVRVCCVRCARVVRARPYQYLGMVEYANRHRDGGDQP